MKRVDQNDTLIISYDEWRDFLLLAPSHDIHHIINFWRHSSYLDVSEDINVPEIATGWRHLAAGAVAGAVSRTCMCFLIIHEIDFKKLIHFNSLII